MIRKPMDGDVDQTVRLLYQSGQRMFSYFFVKDEPDIYPILAFLYENPNTQFSKENMWVKVEAGEVCGVLLCVPARELGQMDDQLKRYLSGLAKQMGIIDFSRFLSRSSLQTYMTTHEDDEFYLSNIAVADSYRGRGFGVELLEKAEELARDNGYDKLTLMVEHYNASAKAIYEKFGFQVVETVDFPERYHRFGIDGYSKMLKRLNPS